MTIPDLLNAYGPIGVEVMKKALQEVNATGKTIDSVGFAVLSEDKYDSLVIFAREYTDLLEKGRKPTTKGPSREMIENLTEYARARGMDDPKKAAWAIAVTINKEGDITYRKGGRVVYSDDLAKFVEELSKKAKDVFMDGFRITIKEALHGTKQA